MLVNRTPVTGEIEAYRDGDKDICVIRLRAESRFEGTPNKGAYDITVNIITPYCPITSDGKAPNLHAVPRRDRRRRRDRDQEGAACRAEGKEALAEGCRARQSR